MVSQAKGGCSVCKDMKHTAMYHKPRKPLKRTPIVRKANDAKTLKLKPAKKAVKKVPSRKLVVKKMDTVFSVYIRLRDAFDMNGIQVAMCVTCGDVQAWRSHQNGHFYTRGRYPTRWHEKNCHVQCVRCNVFLKGNYINYTRFMIDKYGREYVDKLERKSLSGEKISTPRLKEMISEYEEKTKLLIGG